MQRALVILAMFLLVAAALAAGALASHWPFWARAWQWQMADDAWPEQLPGPTQILRGGAAALPLEFSIDPEPPAEAAGSDTWLLLHASADGPAHAFLAPGYSDSTLVDGRGLATGLLGPLFGMLAVRHPGLLDTPISTHLDRWRDDPRGEVTARQLLWQLSGFPAGELRPLNPFSARAQLASGPDFERAALRWKQTWPAGSHFEISPVNAQLLTLLAGRISGTPFAEVLEQQLWSQFAAADATTVLDHKRGGMSAHCCMHATATDWLRLGLLLADGGRVGARQLLPAGWVDEMAHDSPVNPGFGLGYRIIEDAAAGRILALESAGRQLLVAPNFRRALLWIGRGQPPANLQRLLVAEAAPGGDMGVTKRFPD